MLSLKQFPTGRTDQIDLLLGLSSSPNQMDGGNVAVSSVIFVYDDVCHVHANHDWWTSGTA